MRVLFLTRLHYTWQEILLDALVLLRAVRTRASSCNVGKLSFLPSEDVRRDPSLFHSYNLPLFSLEPIPHLPCKNNPHPPPLTSTPRFLNIEATSNHSKPQVITTVQPLNLYLCASQPPLSRSIKSQRNYTRTITWSLRDPLSLNPLHLSRNPCK